MSTLEIEGLSVSYGTGSGRVTVVDNVSFVIPMGRVLGLVGESGSGKSTVARAIAGLVKPQAGNIRLAGTDLRGLRAKGQVGMIFQDPFASLNPRMTIRDAIHEVVSAAGIGGREDRSAEVRRLLELVQLTASQAERLPAQLSGGQRQRAAIARALASRPSVLVADEITSALDVSVQATVLNVMRDILAQTQVITLFISHNLAVVRYLSDEVAVMHGGQIVECSDNRSLFDRPQHPYTSVLIDSVPVIRGRNAGTIELVEGDPPDPHDLPTGCRFHPRCPVGPRVSPARTVCETSDPAPDASTHKHRAACHFADPVGS